MNAKQTTEEGEVSSSRLLDGVSRDMAYLASGFCCGLSERQNIDLTPHERARLLDAGRALKAALDLLYPSNMTPTNSRP